MILLLSHSTDPHLAMVSSQLDELGAPWRSVLTDGDNTAELAVSAGRPSAVLRLADEAIDLSPEDTVWYRRALRPPLPALDHHPEAQHFAQEQHWYALIGGMRASGARFINEPSALRAAEFKPEQLVHAIRLGLTVPDTLVTCDRARIVEFARDRNLGQVVVKVVSPGTPLVGPDAVQYMVFTQFLSLSELEPSAVGAAPSIVQVPVPKAFEVRAVVIGNTVLACGIWSQDDTRTAQDWRRDGLLDVRHEPVTPPPEVARAICNLVRSYGLCYGMIDLIVTPDDRWIFLELNPNGQWGWLEDLAGLAISARLAVELTGGL